MCQFKSNGGRETAIKSSTTMESFLKWFLIISILILILYKYGTRNFKYWEKKGVKQLTPFPFMGDNHFAIFKTKNPLEVSEWYYKPFKGRRFGGLYMNQKPFLTVTDPELLKQILVKDADAFLNRHDWFSLGDPLISKNLSILKDEEWRKMRAVMTTVFTSAKMKDMFGFMKKCAESSVESLAQKVAACGQSERGAHEMEFRDFFSRYGTDVIATTAFGLEVDSFKNPNNEFFNSGYVLRNMFTGWQMIKFFLIMTFPRILKTLGVTLLGQKYNDFFISLIKDTIREREEKNIVRKDFIHILMEARKGKGVNENGDLIKGKLPDLTDADIAAQAVIFFFGGFETMASLLGFITYELAVNPEVQEKLYEEIDEVIQRENGVTYDGVMHQMQYLNMVVNETLRKWPPAVMTDRTVSKTYVIPETDNSPRLVLNRGDSVWVSIAGFHYDPEYFPEPQKFDPERFRDEKNTIKPFTYLPFGEGLRHCIGMRYALMETKTVLVCLLRKFILVPSEKTLVPMKISKRRPFALEPKTGGFWLGIKPRK